MSQRESELFDTNGFLRQSEAWSWKLAQQIADSLDLGPITEPRRIVIEYLREHYRENQTIPVMRHVCQGTGLHDHCVTDLFKTPKNAWRIAGLPDPGPEALAYMDTAEIERG